MKAYVPKLTLSLVFKRSKPAKNEYTNDNSQKACTYYISKHNTRHTEKKKAKRALKHTSSQVAPIQCGLLEISNEI